jgi:hypothetical protein
MPTTPDDDAFITGGRKLIAFQKAHPELNEALGLWMVDRSMCELLHPEAAEIFKRDMPEFASDA